MLSVPDARLTERWVKFGWVQRSLEHAIAERVVVLPELYIPAGVVQESNLGSMIQLVISAQEIAVEKEHG